MGLVRFGWNFVVADGYGGKDWENEGSMTTVENEKCQQPPESDDGQSWVMMMHQTDK